MNPIANEHHDSMPDNPELLFTHLQENISKQFLSYMQRMCNNVLINQSDEQLKSYTRHMKHMDGMMCNLREYATKQNDSTMHMELDQLENQMNVYKDRMKK